MTGNTVRRFVKMTQFCTV